MLIQIGQKRKTRRLKNKMSQFDKDLSKNLKALQKEVMAILKNMKKPGLDYNIQFALDSLRPNMIEYTVWIQPPAERINRLSWIGKDFDDLMAQLKKFEEETDDIDVEIAYHGAQIAACQETIDHHEKEIEKLKKEKEEREKE